MRKGHVLPTGGKTIEDYMIEGIVLLKPSTTDGEYYIVIPLILLSMLNSQTVHIPFNVIEPLSSVWDWKKFESFEASFELYKNNLFCSAGFETSSFGGYYGISGNREPDEFVLQPMKDFVEEKHHFLCKDPTPEAVEKLDKTQIITKDNRTILPPDYFKYSFLCASGNPSIDTRVFRQAVDHKQPYMIVKQLKHSTANKPKISAEKIMKHYDRFKDRRKHLVKDFRLVYILITNREITQQHMKEINEHQGIGLVCQHNLEAYVSVSFSSFAVLDNYTTDEKEVVKDVELFVEETNDKEMREDEEVEYDETEDEEMEDEEMENKEEEAVEDEEEEQ